MRKARPPEDPDSATAAYLSALRWLASRELSEGQVRSRLSDRGYSPEAIGPAVERLVRDRTLDDRRTAAAVASSEVRVRRHGPRRILDKLAAMQIDRGLANEIVRDLFGEGDEADLLASALERRLRGRTDRLKDPRERRRVHAYLVRQGFSAAAAADAIRKVK